MYRLDIFWQNEKIISTTLQLGNSYVVGRAGSNGIDIAVPSDSVSRRHAILTVNEQGQIFIEDCNSSNGTFIDGKRITSGQMVQWRENSVLQFSKQINAQITKAVVNKANGQRKIDIDQFSAKSQIIIGRVPECDIILDHPLVSRKHAIINKKGNNWYIVDNNSTNGTLVNDQMITSETLLGEAAKVEICGFSLQFSWTQHSIMQEDVGGGRINIVIRNLSKQVKDGDGRKKTILNKVNLVIKPREFVAILGVSGAGKSTLMEAICGMHRATSGEVLINGNNFYDQYHRFKQLIGYVPQADIIHTELTVEEILTYSARLRLPAEFSAREILQRVEQVMHTLELTAIRHRVASKISGGQRKRVSIGVELLTKPTIFFLDEPSSGLDPGMEKQLMLTMKKLCKDESDGSTVLLVTHATINVDVCDKIIFMASGGNLAFFGTPAEAREYFFKMFGTDDFADIYINLERHENPAQLSIDYQNSEYYRRHIFEQLHRANEQQSFTQIVGKKKKQYNSDSGLRQWWILTQRYAHTFLKDKVNLAVLLIQSLFIAMIIIGVLNWDVEGEAGLFRAAQPRSEIKISDDEMKGIMKDSPIQLGENPIDKGKLEKLISNEGQEKADSLAEISQRSISMGTCVSMMVYTIVLLGGFNSCRELIKELAIYKRERLIKLKIHPYLLSKIAVLSVIFAVQSVLLVGALNIGLKLPNFGMNLLAVFALYFASMMVGLFISSIVKKADQAVSIIVIVIICMIILSGALVPESSLKPEWLRYIFWPAISKWGYELLGGGINEINARIVDADYILDAFKGFEGNFRNHWLILIAWGVIVPYILIALNLKSKDKQSDR